MADMFAMASPSHVLEMLDPLPVMVYAVSRESDLLFWNRECERVTGWEREDVLCPEPGAERLLPDEEYRRQILSDFDAQGRKLQGYECRISCKDGGHRILALSTITSPLLCSDWGAWGMAVDVTDRFRVRERLQMSEAFYRTLVEVQDSCVWRWRSDTTLTFVNRACCRLMGGSREQLIGMRWIDFVSQSLRTDVEGQLRMLRRNPVAFRYANSIRTLKGDTRWIEWQAIPVLGDSGELVEFQSIGSDQTERKEAERALEDAVEDRFRHFGQELHDGVAQELTAVSFILQMALRTEGDWEKLRGLLDQGYSLVCRALEGIQQMSRRLFPTALGSEGLVAALESMAYALECGGDTLCSVLAFRNGEQVDLKDAILPLDCATATHLFRIAQEAVRNAVRHGHAEKIRIEVRWTDTDLQLIVRDDGSGFRGPRPGGLGLESMKRRAYLLGGAFAIAPGVGGGTVVRCRIPVSEAWQDGARSDSAV